MLYTSKRRWWMGSNKNICLYIFIYIYIYIYTCLHWYIFLYVEKIHDSKLYQMTLLSCIHTEKNDLISTGCIWLNAFWLKILVEFTKIIVQSTRKSGRFNGKTLLDQQEILVDLTRKN